MILSNQCIRRAIYDRSLRIEPFDDRRVQPASYDLTLGASFIHRGVTMDVESYYPLWPNEFTLATTIERVTLGPDVAAIVSGCSTEGRRGLIVEMAGFIDPGFDGQITLEIKNCGTDFIRLEPEMRIAQIVFYRMCCPADPPYKGRYQRQSGVVGPREVVVGPR